MSDDERPAKRAKKAPKHEYTVVLLDVGANMDAPVADLPASAIDLAKETLDWIFSRKIFTESPDEFILILFGSDAERNNFSKTPSNIYFCEEEMQTVKVDWLKVIEHEIHTSKTARGDFVSALILGIDYMRSCLESAQEGMIVARNIVLLSNLAGFTPSEHDADDADAIVRALRALDVNLSVIGPSGNFSEYDEAKEEAGGGDAHDSGDSTKVDVKNDVAESVLADIVKRSEGAAVYSFSEALPMLQKFITRKVTVRGQKFLLELDTDLKVPLLMYKKIQIADIKMKFSKIDENTNLEVKRETVYEKIPSQGNADDSKKSPPPGSQADVSMESGGTQREYLRKEDVIKGYKFGSTIVPFNEDDKKAYGWQRETRGIQLMQFAKRSQILQHYLMDGSAYYCIPPSDDEVGCVAVSALVQALIEEDCVALTRYVYNAASTPRIMALFPRRSKKGVDMFVAIQLPFYEDFRGLEFPSLDDPQSKPKAEQMRSMEAFVKAMDLSKCHYDVDRGEWGEALRPRDVPNPKLQRQCEALKHRALHPGTALPDFDSHVITEQLQPIPQLVKLASEPLSWIEKKFPLHETKKALKKEKQEEGDLSLPDFGVDASTLPASGHFITADDVDITDTKPAV